MRLFLIIAVAIGIVTTPITAFSASSGAVSTARGVAPADEYFGRYNESVLEIRNRLSLWERKSQSDVLSPDTVQGLDNLEEAVVAWQHKYPADPWVVDAMSRLIECYARAGFATGDRASAVVAIMVGTYPNTQETKNALAAVGRALVPASDALASTTQTYSSADQVAAADAATIAGSVVDASTGAPVAGAIVVVAPDKDSADVTAEPFAATVGDGSFLVKDVPLSHDEHIVVEPPPSSSYAAYHGVLDASSASVQAGVIKLSAR